jgi:hypothetical protein
MDFQGPASAVEVESVATFHYGRYETSVRFASCAAAEEIVSGIFTYLNDGTDTNGNGIADNSEIDVELLCGEPYLLWLTIWTDYETSPTERFSRPRGWSTCDRQLSAKRAKGKGEYGSAPGAPRGDRRDGLPESRSVLRRRFLNGSRRSSATTRARGAEIELWKFEDAARASVRARCF